MYGQNSTNLGLIDGSNSNDLVLEAVYDEKPLSLQAIPTLLAQSDRRPCRHEGRIRRTAVWASHCVAAGSRTQDLFHLESIGPDSSSPAGVFSIETC